MCNLTKRVCSPLTAENKKPMEWLFQVIYHSFAGPVKLVIVDITHPVKEIAEQFTKVIVIWSLEEV
jgi:hypothetical protein